MGNFVMTVDFFGHKVRAETEGEMVCLSDMVSAGNMHRMERGRQPLLLRQLTTTVGYEAFCKALREKRGCEQGDIVRIIGKGRAGRTMAALPVAVYIAEQISPEFHVEVIDAFIEGQLLKMRLSGAVEFVQLNRAIDKYMPERDGRDNVGLYIQTAIALREKILGKDAVAGDWNKATVSQTENRYVLENKLVDFLRMGFIRDLPHIREIIKKF